MWRAEDHSDDENLRWCLLRAQEWIGWPFFLSQSVAPLLLLRFPGIVVVEAFVILSLAWIPVRLSLINPTLSCYGVYFVTPRLLITIGAGAWLIFTRRFGQGGIALCWPLVAGVGGAVLGGAVGPVHGRFMVALGYTMDGAAQKG